MHADRTRALFASLVLLALSTPGPVSSGHVAAQTGCAVPPWFHDTLEWTGTSTGWWNNDPQTAGYTMQLQFLEDGRVRRFRDEELVSVGRYDVTETPFECRYTFDIIAAFEGEFRTWDPSPELHGITEVCDDCYAYSFESRPDIDVATCAVDDRLPGSWEWVETHWPFSGITITPWSEGYTEQLEMDGYGNLSTFRDLVLERDSKYEVVDRRPNCVIISQALEDGPWRWVFSFDDRYLDLVLDGECTDSCRYVRFRRRGAVPARVMSWGRVKSLF